MDGQDARAARPGHAKQMAVSRLVNLHRVDIDEVEGGTDGSSHRVSDRGDVTMEWSLVLLKGHKMQYYISKTLVALRTQQTCTSSSPSYDMLEASWT